MLTADPSASSNQKLTLHGRVLAAVAALSKGDADKLREDRDKKGNTKTDRRNLYLMREGGKFDYLPSSPSQNSRTDEGVANLQSSSLLGPSPKLSLLPTWTLDNPLSTLEKVSSVPTLHFTSPELVSLFDKSLFTLPMV